MEINILIQIFLFSLALSMDALAVSITDGLTYSDLNKKKTIIIPITFGLMQGIMPLFGYWIVELISYLGGQAGGEKAGAIISTVVVWIAFTLLLFIGGKMLIESIISLKKKSDEPKTKLFSFKEVLLMGLATSIDAMATGVAFHSGLSTNSTIWLHALIIIICTFLISLIGITLSKQLQKLFKGKYEVSGIIGGVILLLLALWIILSHYLGI